MSFAHSSGTVENILLDGNFWERLIGEICAWYLVFWFCHKFCYWGWGVWQRILEFCMCWLNFCNLMWRYHFKKSEILCVFNTGLNHWVTNLSNTFVTVAQLWRNEMWNILHHFHFGGHIGKTFVWFTWHKGNFLFELWLKNI